MSAGPEELVTEDEAARYLGVTEEGVREFALQDILHPAVIERPGGVEMMYLWSELRALKERLGVQDGAAGDEEWPDVLT